jgi:hypothetical protein
MSTDQEVQSYLDDAFDGDYRDGVSHLKNMTLDPIFTTGDERFFDVINRSSWANTHIDLSKLYAYYAVDMDQDGDRTGAEVTLPEDTGNPGGNTGGNDDGNTTPGDNTGSDQTGDGGTDTTDTPGNSDGTTIVLCEDGSTPPCLTNPNTGNEDTTDADVDSSNSEDVQQNAKIALVGIIAVMGIGLYLISKTGSEDLNLSDEAQIEKIWDADELDVDLPKSDMEEPEFIPAPPPIEAQSPPESKEED